MKIFPVFIPHGGCPHQCLFCAQDRTNSQAEIPTTEQTFKILDKMLPVKGQGEIAFYGGTFTLLPVAEQERYLEIAKRFIEQDRAGSIRISTRPDAIARVCLERLQAYGVSTVELGCQSFSDEVLQSSGRGHNAADNSAAIQICRDQGFAVGVQLMPGLPEDQPRTAITSCRRALALNPDFLRIYPTIVVAGSPLAKLWQQGLFLPWSLDQAIDVCAEMFLYCHRADIPVIRTGLQQDPRLEANLLAGPYHPAFGQLVRSRLWRLLLKHAAEIGRRFYVNPADYSDAIGHRGENRTWLAAHDEKPSLTSDASVERGMLRVAGQHLNLFNDLSARIRI